MTTMNDCCDAKPNDTTRQTERGAALRWALDALPDEIRDAIADAAHAAERHEAAREAADALEEFMSRRFPLGWYDMTAYEWEGMELLPLDDWQKLLRWLAQELLHHTDHEYRRVEFEDRASWSREPCYPDYRALDLNAMTARTWHIVEVEFTTMPDPDYEEPYCEPDDGGPYEVAAYWNPNGEVVRLDMGEWGWCREEWGRYYVRGDCGEPCCFGGSRCGDSHSCSRRKTDPKAMRADLTVRMMRKFDPNKMAELEHHVQTLQIAWRARRHRDYWRRVAALRRKERARVACHHGKGRGRGGRGGGRGGRGVGRGE